MIVSIFPLSLLNGILNLITVLQALIRFKYSSGMSVFEAALSKKSLTYSRNLGSWNSSNLGPKLDGSRGLVFYAAAEKLIFSVQES